MYVCIHVHMQYGEVNCQVYIVGLAVASKLQLCLHNANDYACT